jgi:hypothetical protein
MTFDFFEKQIEVTTKYRSLLRIVNSRWRWRQSLRFLFHLLESQLIGRRLHAISRFFCVEGATMKCDRYVDAPSLQKLLEPPPDTLGGESVHSDAPSPNQFIQCDTSVIRSDAIQSNFPAQ